MFALASFEVRFLSQLTKSATLYTILEFITIHIKKNIRQTNDERAISFYLLLRQVLGHIKHFIQISSSVISRPSSILDSIVPASASTLLVASSSIWSSQGLIGDCKGILLGHHKGLLLLGGYKSLLLIGSWEGLLLIGGHGGLLWGLLLFS